MVFKQPRHTHTKEIQKLNQKLRTKLQQVEQLQEVHWQLSYRHNLLSSTCDLLQLISEAREAAGQQPVTGLFGNLAAAAAAADTSSRRQPLAAELDLLHQLQCMPLRNISAHSYCSAADTGTKQGAGLAPEGVDVTGGRPMDSYCRTDSSSSSSFASSPGGRFKFDILELGEHETLGTAEDPLRALRHALARQQQQQPLVDAEQITLQQLQQDYQATITQLALNVAFLDNPVSRSQDVSSNPYEVIKRVLVRHSQMLTALLVTDRAHIIPTFMMSDVVTGEQKEELKSEVYDLILQRLGLTKLQLQRMVCSLNVFRSLLGSVLEERQHLQQRIASIRSGLGAGSNGSNGSSGSSITGVDADSKAAVNQQQQQQRAEQLQQQQQLLQIVKLLKKEGLLKCCCWVSIEGCLTFVQLAKLAIACYPHPASPLAVAQAAERVLQKEERQPALRQAQEGPQAGAEVILG